jgi:hypothetical protein
MKTALSILVCGLVLSVAGFAAEPLTNKNVKQLISSANGPADHLRLANYFELEAQKFEAEAKEHADMARNYRANPNALETKLPGAVGTAKHCESLSRDLAHAAKGARTLAADHTAMAKQP